ncbi:MAG: hypothetical protein HFG80_07785 [Eubacterium sp.]|nr:hypothetical protein [Eubacterium sp.]
MKNSLSKLFLLLLLSILICWPLTPFSVSAANIPPIILSSYQKQMNISDEYQLIAVTSNGKLPTFKSSNSAVASVNTYGVVTAKKPGEADIKVSVQGTTAVCKVTVKKPTVTLSKRRLALYRPGTAVSTGKATIYCKENGVKKSCTVKAAQP